MSQSTTTALSTSKPTDNIGKASLWRSPEAELMFLQATGNYSWLYWKNGKKVLLARTLTYYQAQLSNAWFIRLHRNCIVNLLFVERLETLEATKGGLVYLRSGDVLPVSRRRLSQVKRVVSRYQTLGNGRA
ncbi:LytR/AlgR family response regulator transcription factor [Spirosoma pollinicola]|uniref:Response regulator receiver protein n=1 Tax=Spirosoma pollinicola TaxID=2057025 RepID=A0A2K8YV01_9BACT|nr:LytTR family DNA-binding domain-containing protein [Spirosoma pollinicola]AUD01443.1 response regulator receiver protein [Spirosoma pollinicola]